jgi:HEAT repeat protein
MNHPDQVSLQGWIFGANQARMLFIPFEKGDYKPMLPSLRLYLVGLFIVIVAAPVFAVDLTPEQMAWKILDRGLNDKSSAKRHDAIHALGLLMGDARAVAIAEKALEDRAPEIREAAATSLGELHSSSSIPKLELALNDKDITVVLAAAHSLWVLQDKKAFDIYYEILVGERKAGPGMIAQQEEMFKDKKKFAQFAFEQGIEFNPFAGIGWGIVKTLHTDTVSPVKASAAKALIDDPDPRTGQALAKSCSDKSWIVRLAALEALARRGDQTVINEIERRLTDEKDLVRYIAAAAIVRLSSTPPQANPEKAVSTGQ